MCPQTVVAVANKQYARLANGSPLYLHGPITARGLFLCTTFDGQYAKITLDGCF
jgi:hypothetical protein